ncbi:unnamed protein product, partial [Tetraodon nigroviridis]
FFSEMNLSHPDQTMHSSGDGCLEDDKPDVMFPCYRRNVYDEPLSSYSSGSIISQLLRKTIHSARALDESHFYLSGSGVADCGQEDQTSVSSKDSTMEASSPGAHVSAGVNPDQEHPVTDHLQAKRARVENIIRVMAGSPNSRQHGESEKPDTDAKDLRESREAYRENKRKQRRPGSSNSDTCNAKDEECHKLKEQLHSMQKLLHQLQEKFLQVYNQEDPEQNNRDEPEVTAEHDPTGENLASHYTGSEDDFERKTSRQRMCSTPKLHIGLGVDRRSQAAGSAQEHLQDEEAAEKKHSLEYYESPGNQSPQDQTEALSLVVRKPEVTPLGAVAPTVKRPYPVHQTPFQFNYSASLHDSQILEHLLKYGPHSSFGGLQCIPPPMDRTSPDSVDLTWDAIAMRSKVTSGHLGHHARPSALGAVSVDNLCLPHVKIECDLKRCRIYFSIIRVIGATVCAALCLIVCLNANVNIQEGLTPSHLKKAKLMFFYTRYPSSNVLKTYFPDVKASTCDPWGSEWEGRMLLLQQPCERLLLAYSPAFNRCITSQLIKWFSNFREFYYIQMEKFARQAIADGVSDVKDITVSRDSELFRALNMHYNKANDFHVPDRFLEVAEITLHEFYNAIVDTKDSDPSWKKAIYKVICKLDSDVPEEFKTSSYFYILRHILQQVDAIKLSGELTVCHGRGASRACNGTSQECGEGGTAEEGMDG